jgi:predicted metalloprotease
VAFRKRWFDRGYRKGEAKDPAEVKRENPPDEWSRSH